jgi:hypothetical protein
MIQHCWIGTSTHVESRAIYWLSAVDCERRPALPRAPKDGAVGFSRSISVA